MKIINEMKRPAGQDKIAKQAASYILKVQSRLADSLNSKAKHLRGKALLFALILFSVAFGGYCLYLILIAFL